jgi:LacI family transcriptional regulator
VLAGVSRGRARTREQVFAAAHELEYTPSGVARSLKLRVTHTIGLVITDIENPFYPELVRAIEDRAHELGYSLLLGNSVEDPDREAAYLDLLASRRVDGVIVAAAGVAERHAATLAASAIPAVLVNCETADGSLPAAVSDNRGGGRLAAEHLLGLGHRRLGVVTVAQLDRSAIDRVAGVRDALEAAGIDGSTLACAAGERTVSGGQDAMHRLLARRPAVTGVVSHNDVMAIGALRALRAAGRRVPLDVSVVGFDDIELAAYVEPPLTTIRQDTALLGRWGVDHLVAQLDARARPRAADASAVVRAGVRLVVRATTGPPPRDAR